jgi:sodium/proline symporter
VVYTLVSYGWAGLAGAFAPSITLSFWWKKFSKAGVYAAFIVGIITTVAWIASGLDALLTVRFASFVIPSPRLSSLHCSSRRIKRRIKI